VPERRFFVGIDIGGTFTDVVVAERGARDLRIAKKLTTPSDPALAVREALLEALASANAAAGDLDRAVHATTLATNVILEGKGARVGYVTTQGFADTLSMSDVRRREPDRYDLFFENPEPPVPRRRIAEVRERVGAGGKLVTPLDEEQACAEIARVLRDGPGEGDETEAVAVCFLHSYANPAHERRAGEIVRELLPGAYVVLSSDVCPQYREFPRASTAVMSAYVGPVVASYIERLEAELREMGLVGAFQIMQSNGGVMTARAAVARPINSVESGPAAGVIAAAYFGRLFGMENIVSFDMGGTTAKAGLVRGGQPAVTNDFYVGGAASHRSAASGYPVKIPVIDLAEVGAGGGSIARVDPGGALQVGPESAGADPGPACYGFGGDRPTVTDANLALGYLNPDYFLGGAMRIHPDRSREAIEVHVAKPLGLSLTEAAAGIYDVVNANMASAVRMVTVQRGIDPRDFSIIAFGGAGPAHVARLAEEFGTPSVIVPVTPGTASAFGLLVSDMSADYARTKVLDPAADDMSEIDAIFAELEAEGVERMRDDGVPPDAIHVERQIDARFRFQSHELSVPAPPGPLSAESTTAVDAFRARYEELYGIRLDNPVEFVTYRVKIVGEVPKAELAASDRADGVASNALKGSRPAFFREAADFIDTPVYDRERLRPGAEIGGPAIIEEPDSTIVVPPPFRAAVDAYRSVVLTRA